MKITRAMELIAASRIAKAAHRVKAAQPYTRKMTDVIRNIAAASGGIRHPLLETREPKNIGVLVVTSDRGLAGAYNTNVIRLAERQVIAHQKAGRDVRIYAVGRKAQAYFKYRNYSIERTFLGVTDTPSYADARSIANTVMNDYSEGTIDVVEAYTTKYRTAMTQEAVLWPLLPIEPPDVSSSEGIVSYTFEPSPEGIVTTLLPRYVEAVIFGILLEASASEHTNRQRAMKAATENAEELTRVLTRQANQARQAEITTEISEIVGGAEALTQG